MKLVFLGFGTVGQGLAELLVAKRDELKKRYGFDWMVTGIADTIKGKGVSFMEGKLEWHYRSPNPEQLAQALAELGVS